MAHVFTYGSLMFAEVWQAVTGEHCTGIPARLPGHVRLAVRGASFPGVSPRAGGAVDGLLYTDVSPDALLALDRFEGGEYARREVRVHLADGTRIAAHTYIYLDPDRLADSPWDAAGFDVSTFMSRYCQPGRK